MCAWDGWVRERSTIFGDGRLDQGADKMDEDIEVDQQKSRVVCSDAPLRDWVYQGRPQWCFQGTPNSKFSLRPPFASASISSTQSYSPTSDFAVRAKKALEVGVLESWNLRGGEWEKVGGRRQK